MEIVKYPNPILTRACRSVTKEELRLDATQNLIDEMLREVYDHRGQHWVGLSANQVGSDLRIFVGFLKEGNLQAVVNPSLTLLPGKTKLSKEGCVSLGGVEQVVPRSKNIALSLTSRDGEERNLRISGYYATVVQHEVDHLSGRLIIAQRRLSAVFSFT